MMLLVASGSQFGDGLRVWVCERSARLLLLVRLACHLLLREEMKLPLSLRLRGRLGLACRVQALGASERQTGFSLSLGRRSQSTVFSIQVHAFTREGSKQPAVRRKREQAWSGLGERRGPSLEQNMWISGSVMLRSLSAIRVASLC